MDDQATVGGLNSHPLYVQVRATLVERIRNGQWKPGQLIPNEFELAREMGVSQGTVRKALGAMTADQLLVRRQGRGTFVVEHTPDTMLFRFFNLYNEDGQQVLPVAKSSKGSTGVANAEERRKLGLEAGEKVVRIVRVRSHEGIAFVIENIVVSDRLFPGLIERSEIPNTLYDHFQSVYGITVARGEEQLTAVIAKAREAKLLDIEPGCPLLRLDRVMFALDASPVEWRVSLCNLKSAHYLVHLR